MGKICSRFTPFPLPVLGLEPTNELSVGVFGAEHAVDRAARLSGSEIASSTISALCSDTGSAAGVAVMSSRTEHELGPKSSSYYSKTRKTGRWVEKR